MAKTHTHLAPSTQAAQIIARFGGAYPLSRAMRACADTDASRASRSPSVIFRWTYPRSRGGTDGRIPNAAWPAVLDAARYMGIFLTDKERQAGL